MYLPLNELGKKEKRKKKKHKGQSGWRENLKCDFRHGKFQIRTSYSCEDIK